MTDETIYQEQKKLVLARFNTINPELKIMLGNIGNLSIKDLINHVQQDDDFGKKIVRAQISMLKVLTSE
ncbi:MAG TPA: hypothetical protein VJK72_04070 [Candidatus Nanoarchaeia archaeon]|nr:hypothetical protein [Candidatus Nanoarchaeia archaeon]